MVSGERLHLMVVKVWLHVELGVHVLNVQNWRRRGLRDFSGDGIARCVVRGLGAVGSFGGAHALLRVLCGWGAVVLIFEVILGVEALLVVKVIVELAELILNLLDVLAQLGRVALVVVVLDVP